MAMTREKTIGIAGTILFHAILLLCLLFYYVKPADTNLYTDELGGVPVMFGNVSDAFGKDEPKGKENGLSEDIQEKIEPVPTLPNYIDNAKDAVKDKVEKTPQVKPSVTTTKAPPTTQEMDKTVAVVDTKKQEAEKKRKESEAAEQKKKAEAERKVREEQDRKKNINSQMAGLFGNGSGSGSRGNSEGTGTQGSPSGNSSTGKLSGVAGLGSYDLGGRGLGANGLILPSYNVDDYGNVVVDIIVDPQGNVIEATIGRGTTTANTSLRNESLKAAKRTKFSIVKTSNNQRGTITYRFNLN